MYPGSDTAGGYGGARAVHDVMQRYGEGRRVGDAGDARGQSSTDPPRRRPSHAEGRHAPTTGRTGSTPRCQHPRFVQTLSYVPGFNRPPPFPTAHLQSRLACSTRPRRTCPSESRHYLHLVLTAPRQRCAGPVPRPSERVPARSVPSEPPPGRLEAVLTGRNGPGRVRTVRKQGRNSADGCGEDRALRGAPADPRSGSDRLEFQAGTTHGSGRADAWWCHR